MHSLEEVSVSHSTAGNSCYDRMYAYAPSQKVANGERLIEGERKELSENILFQTTSATDILNGIASELEELAGSAAKSPNHAEVTTG